MASKTVIEVVVALVIAAILLPVAGNLLFNANTTGWDSTSVSIFKTLFIIGLVAILLAILFTYLTHRRKSG